MTFAHSGADEYVPPRVNVARLAKRFVAAAGGERNGCRAIILEGANHNCATGPNAAKDFIRCVCETLGDAV